MSTPMLAKCYNDIFLPDNVVVHPFPFKNSNVQSVWLQRNVLRVGKGQQPKVPIDWTLCSHFDEASIVVHILADRSELAIVQL